MATLGMRGTGSFAADHRPENYREKYLMLEPNGSAPLTAILSMLPSEATDDPEFHNFRKDLPDFRFTHSGTATASGTTLTATSATDLSFIRIGMLMRNFTTGEVVKVTGTPTTTTLTVTRGVGNGGTGATVTANDIFFMIGNANAEGADVPDSISYDAASTENFCQIFRTPYSITRTAMHTNFRTGDQYLEKSRDALKEHMVGMERAMIFGKKDIITGSAGRPERYTDGLMNSITTNVEDAAANANAGVLTEAEFDAFLAEKAFSFGSSEKLMLCGWKVADHLQKLAKNRYQINSTGTGDAYGVMFTTYNTFAGTLQVKTHPMFRQIPGAEKDAIILDTKDLRYRYVDDTQLLKDRQGNGVDGVIDEYLTESGLEILQEKTHAVITGWNATS